METSSPARESLGAQSGETADVLFDGRLTVLQSRSGYRFSIDTLLLAHFVSVKRADRIVDLGCGNAVLSLALLRLHPSATVTGIELQASMVERARRNVRLNGLDEKIEIVHGDVRGRRQMQSAASFTVAVCNPPYRKPGSGRVSAEGERRVARHELNGDLGEFVGAASYFLRNKGRAALVYLAPRAADLIVAMRRAGIEPKRLRTVHSFPDAEASMVLLEGVKGGRPGLAVLPPLTIYRAGKKYSEEVTAIIAGTRP